MGTWNYRIIDHGEWLGLHKVHYDKQGNPRMYAIEPEIATDKENGVQDIIGSLEMMLKAAKSDIQHLTEFDFKPHQVEPEVFFADLSKRVSEKMVDIQLSRFREIAERVAAEMKLKMPDDVKGHLSESHIVFGTACAYEALQEPPHA